jgi:hypothetical protein
MAEAIGRLERVRAREAWPHEARDFTPWLLANADALGEAIGMDLRLEQSEVAVGGFALDLLGVDEVTGETVIVENQLEGSDHNHLGQLLTYAGGVEPANIIWVAESFRPEHRAAMTWLNERTDEHTRFFAVEVAAVRIASSPFAPLFDVVVEPNDWQKQVRSASSAATRSDREETNRRFWQGWLEQMHVAAPGWTNARQARAQNWMNLPAGMSGVHYAAVITGKTVSIEIYIGTSDAALNVAYLEELERHRIAIDSGFGGEPAWQELDGKKACRIRLSSPASRADEKAWPEYQAWLVDHLLSLRAAIDGLGGLPTLLRNVSVSD